MVRVAVLRMLFLVYIESIRGVVYIPKDLCPNCLKNSNSQFHYLLVLIFCGSCKSNIYFVEDAEPDKGAQRSAPAACMMLGWLKVVFVLLGFLAYIKIIFLVKQFKVSYCSKECQVAHYKIHRKKLCCKSVHIISTSQNQCREERQLDMFLLSKHRKDLQRSQSAEREPQRARRATWIAIKCIMSCMKFLLSAAVINAR